MALKSMEIGLVAVVVTMLLIGANAQSSCTNVLISLSPCLNYITGNSSTPSSSCCSQLASVVTSQPQCLCQVLNGGGSSLGLNINQTQALALPDACKVQTPPLSRCNAAAPADSPAGTPDSPKTIICMNADGGSKTVPSTDNTSSGSSATLSFSLLFILVLISSYATTPGSF
ncbi:hypothetical protein Syun_007307 [Stephania yunnanensis]|uniref:Bifunctional inhibitor/plant lipid transfer protein/seed storage helical domain-containing protein n=1 Tax=Stephania yunnanensis TaxID=152371 RepID=A0AAP0KYI7_9MAGN